MRVGPVSAAATWLARARSRCCGRFAIFIDNFVEMFLQNHNKSHCLQPAGEGSDRGPDPGRERHCSTRSHGFAQLAPVHTEPAVAGADSLSWVPPPTGGWPAQGGRRHSTARLLSQADSD